MEGANIARKHREESSSDELSSDGWEDEWPDYVILPPGFKVSSLLPVENVLDPLKYLRKHFFSQKYKNGNCKFKIMERIDAMYLIQRLCPCGTLKCDTHVDGTDKMRPVRRWLDICKFPKGHELQTFVRQGQEMQTLQQRFNKEKYKISEITLDRYKVEQLCPCGKTECDKHVFPSKVELESSFTLATHTIPTASQRKRKTTLIEPLFRKEHAMTFDQAKQFFDQFKLNWNVFVTALKITFWMVCRCGKAFEHTPCGACEKKNWAKCFLCGDTRKKRMLKKQHPSKNSPGRICSDCKIAEISFCEFCKKDARLDHECTKLQEQHIVFKKNSVRKDLSISKGAKVGICPYCKQTCAYRSWGRHFKRCHGDLKSYGMYSHETEEYFCDYCDYSNYDKTNVKQHSKMHLLYNTHPCKLGCGMSFRHHPEEIIHRRKVHGVKPPAPKRKHRRVGKKVVLMKRQKKDPEPSTHQTPGDNVHRV